MRAVLIICYVFVSCALTAQGKADQIVGVWLTEDKKNKIEIYKKNNKYYGKVVWLIEPNDDKGNPHTDKENPNSALRSRPIMGLDIITNMVYKDGEWSGGHIYDPNDGKKYTLVLWLEDGKLKVRGYIGWFFDTRTWTRVKN